MRHFKLECISRFHQKHSPDSPQSRVSVSKNPSLICHQLCCHRIYKCWFTTVQMATLKSQLHYQMNMEESETQTMQLPHLVSAYNQYENIISEEADEDFRLMCMLEGDQLQKVETRRAYQGKLGLKLLELITYNFIVIEKGSTEEQCNNFIAQLQKWIQEKYGKNQENLFITLAKVFYYQDPLLLRGIKNDFQMQLLKFRYKEYLNAKIKENPVKQVEKVVFAESLSSILPPKVSANQSQMIQSSEGQSLSQSLQTQNQNLLPPQQTFISATQANLILEKMRNPYQKKQQSSSDQQGSQISKSPNVTFRSQQNPPNKMEQSNKSVETTKSQMSMPIQFQVGCYLSELKYYKQQLTQFCHQLGFQQPSYTNVSKPKDQSYTIHCKLNFTSQYTKFATRNYQAEQSDPTYKKAQQKAAFRVLKLIYTKHKDLWHKFKEIKLSKNIKTI